MSKNMKKRGFTFVGTTICYAFMQAAGLVNDHLEGCFRFDELGGISGNGVSEQRGWCKVSVPLHRNLALNSKPEPFQ
jgi:hypothetical protein